MTRISPDANIGEGVRIAPSALIEAGAIIGANCEIGEFCVLGGRVSLGEGSRVETGCVVGYDSLTRIHDPTRVSHRLEIGPRCLIRAGAQIYRGSRFGEGVQIGHAVLLREGCDLGEGAIIGNHVVSEGYARVGTNSTVHAQTHLTAFIDIGDYVFVGPHVVTMNDPKAAHFRPSLQREVRGPTIRRGARIGAGAVLCPAVEIGEEAFIAAGALVTKNVPPRELWVGTPARKMGEVTGEPLESRR